MFNPVSHSHANLPLAPPEALAVCLTLCLLLPLQAIASGVAGGGFSGIEGTSAPREVDEVYEFGKALYLGRTPDSKKIKYCVKVDGQLKKLGGRVLRPYRGSDQLDFANALYDCNNPEQQALLNINREQVAYVLYYLNKRYKLELTAPKS